jgi:predicted TIM-barrel fold metal-dependent hydrolase
LAARQRLTPKGISAMWNGFKVIDADAHMHEPQYLYDRYLEPEFRDQCPKVIGMDGIGFIYAPDGKFVKEEPKAQMGLAKWWAGIAEKYGEAYREWWSPDIRLRDMDRFGWDIQVCLPTMRNGNMAMDVGLIDPKVGAAMARAYHAWCHEYCGADPKRLKFTAVLPGGDVDEMVAEARRAVEKLGAVSVRNPLLPEGKWLHQRENDRLWQLACELDFPISLHGEYRFRWFQPFAALQKGEGAFSGLNHVIGFPFDNMAVLGHFIFGGILERFPKLRLGVLESNAGWAPFFLARMDDHTHGRQANFFDASPLPLKPSEYFRRQCFISADADEAALKYAVDFLGEDNIIFNTDYPHPDAPDPEMVMPALMAQPIPESAKRKIAWDNSVRLYGPRLLSEGG